MAKGIVGVNYFVITDQYYNDLVAIFGSDFMHDFERIDGVEGLWFAKQSAIYGDNNGDREYERIVDMIGLNLGVAYFTRSTEPVYGFPGV